MSTMNSLPTSSAVGGENLFSLKWNHYHSYLTTGLAKLLEENDLTDLTLACEGQFIQCHKVALAVCSPFFKEYFKTYRMEKPGGLIVLANVRFKDLKNLLQFIYHGQVNVSNADLTSFLKTAKDLQIEGLADGAEQGNVESSITGSTENVKPCSSATAESLSASRLPVSTSSYTHTTSNNNGSPAIKRSRLSTGTTVPTTSATINVQTPSFPSASSSSVIQSDPSTRVLNPQESTATSVPLPHSSNYDPLDMEDEEEEMILLDQVKPEPIAVYTLNDDNDDEDSIDHHGDDNLVGGLGNESSGMMYHDYESQLNQPSGPGPSSSNLHPAHRMQSSEPNPRIDNKPTVVAGQESLENSGSISFQELIDTFKMKCKQCGESVASDQFHMHHCTNSQNVPTGTVEPVICPQCGKTFKNKNSLKVHKSTYHRLQNTSKISSGTRLSSLVDLEFPSTVIQQTFDAVPPSQSRLFLSNQKHTILPLVDEFENGSKPFRKVKLEQTNSGQQQLHNPLIEATSREGDTSSSVLEPVLQRLVPFTDQTVAPISLRRPQNAPSTPVFFGDMDALDALQLKDEKPETRE